MHHHEREDGLGYPHGIEGNDVIQEVKIISFCDVFDALTSPRPYQKQMGFKEALEFIEKNLLEYVDERSLKALQGVGQIANLKVPHNSAEFSGLSSDFFLDLPSEEEL